MYTLRLSLHEMLDDGAIAPAEFEYQISVIGNTADIITNIKVAIQDIVARDWRGIGAGLGDWLGSLPPPHANRTSASRHQRTTATQS